MYFEWMRYLSWFMYGNEALSINQWSGVTFNDSVCTISLDGKEVCHQQLFTGEQILMDFEFNPVILKYQFVNCEKITFRFRFYTGIFYS